MVYEIVKLQAGLEKPLHLSIRTRNPENPKIGESIFRNPLIM